MKPGTQQQEVLLFTHTGFANREWSPIASSDSRRLNPVERFEEACWNGIIREVLPEIFSSPYSASSVRLWEVREARSCLQLELGNYPADLEAAGSINPYLFCEVQNLN